MNYSQAARYLAKHYPNVVSEKIKGGTVKRWLQRGFITGLTSSHIDDAVKNHTIPPKSGKPKRFSFEDKLNMIKLRENGKSLTEIAKMYGCSDSYVSLVVRDLR